MLQRVSALLLVAGLAVGVKEMVLHFNQVEYFHRWSKAGQHEFTPKGQEDLDHWQDMVTVNVHDDVKDEKGLADLANQVTSRYQATGKVVRVDMSPRTKDHPGEPFVAAVLAGPTVREAAFARFLLQENHGIVVVYSRRIYGTKAEAEMIAWINANGQKTEQVLRSWAEIPTVAQLKDLH